MTDPIEQAFAYLDIGHPTVKAALAEIARLRAIESRVLAERQPVAVIGRDWQLLWASPVSLKEIVDRHNLKIGTPLFTHPTPDDAFVRGLKVAREFALYEATHGPNGHALSRIDAAIAKGASK